MEWLRVLCDLRVSIPVSSVATQVGGYAMTINELTHAIIGSAIRVHRFLGPGLLESAYRVCLAYELKKLDIPTVQEIPIPVVYEGVKLECGYRADMIVAQKVLVECKAKEVIHPIDQAQVLSHL